MRLNLWTQKYPVGEWFDIQLVIGLEDKSMLTEFQVYSFGVADISLSDITID